MASGYAWENCLGPLRNFSHLIIPLSNYFIYCRFKSNHFLTGLGFQILYEATNVSGSTFIGACGGNYRSPHGFLASPLYPYNPYPNEVNCICIVSGPNSTRINITLIDIDIEYTSDYYDYYSKYQDMHQFEGNTCFDYLEVRNGGSETSDLLGKYCGDSDVLSLPFSLQSTQEHLWIRLATN